MNAHYYSADFEIGMRVEVIQHHQYRRYNLIGKTGTVRGKYNSEIRVELDDMINPNAGSGHFHFKLKELKIIDEDNVRENENMPNIKNYFNAVKIQFINNTKPCDYIYANFDRDLKTGDLCVVKPAHHEMTLARVVEILEGNSYETTREVVAVVDTSFYDERVKIREKATKLKARMQERAKKLQDIALYQMLAENDSEMMELLNDYQNLPMF